MPRSESWQHRPRYKHSQIVYSPPINTPRSTPIQINRLVFVDPAITRSILGSAVGTRQPASNLWFTIWVLTSVAVDIFRVPTNISPSMVVPPAQKGNKYAKPTAASNFIRNKNSDPRTPSSTAPVSPGHCPTDIARMPCTTTPHPPVPTPSLAGDKITVS